MKIAVVLLSFCISLSACMEEGAQAQIPADFNFRCDPVAADVYDLSDSTYKHCMLHPRRDTSIHIRFSDVEKQRVYAVMVKNHFWEMNCEEEGDSSCIPSGYKSFLEATANGRQNCIRISLDCDQVDEECSGKFKEIRGVIFDILQTKDCFRKLPPSGINFL